MKVQFRPAALVDLDGIYDSTVELWSVAQADYYHAQLMSTLDQLLQHPRSGHVYPAISTSVKFRSIPSGHHLIFYIIDGATLDMVRILHDRMDIRAKLLDESHGSSTTK
ncbi:MAG: type II toxin-antitoxin system RelE/ParE family toxin [Gammaproteobacteria bacterium]|nr:type II toxin-antitoxin system RelE/ParE family toxin [Gammaproteobacteria bacterium]